MGGQQCAAPVIERDREEETRTGQIGAAIVWHKSTVTVMRGGRKWCDTLRYRTLQEFVGWVSR
jgi:hypothetical protein